MRNNVKRRRDFSAADKLQVTEHRHASFPSDTVYADDSGGDRRGSASTKMNTSNTRDTIFSSFRMNSCGVAWNRELQQCTAFHYLGVENA